MWPKRGFFLVNDFFETQLGDLVLRIPLQQLEPTHRTAQLNRHMPSVLALKAHVRMLSVVLALIVPTVQSSESGCQAASPFGLTAGYSPPSNVSAMIDVDLPNMDTALGATTPDYTNILAIYEAGGLPALSNTTKALMYDCAAGCPLKHTRSTTTNTVRAASTTAATATPACRCCPADDLPAACRLAHLLHSPRR